MKKTFITICAWCPDNTARTRALMARGYEVSHGLCPTCAARQMAELASPARRLLEIAPEEAPAREPVRFSCRLRSRAELSPICAAVASAL